VLAQILQELRRAAARVGEGCGEQDAAVQHLGQALQPGGRVHRGADHREVEPRRRADVAEHQLAHVQRQPVAERLAPVGGAPLVERQHRPARLDRGAERPHAGALLVQREHREHPVADELQDLAAVAGDRVAQRVEEVVQHVEHLAGRQALGERGRAAQVAVPDRGPDRGAGTTYDLARQHPLAGVVADVGVEQVLGEPPVESDLGCHRQHGQQVVDAQEILGREAAGPFGAPGRGVALLVRGDERQRHVVGEALGPQVGVDAELVVPAHVQPLPDRLRSLVECPDRAVDEARVVEHPVLDRRHDRLAQARPPHHPHAHELRVQHADVQAGPVERQPLGQEPLAQLGEQVVDEAQAGRPVHEPVEGRSGKGRPRTLPDRRLPSSARLSPPPA
jgi:hypothetical protein